MAKTDVKAESGSDEKDPRLEKVSVLLEADHTHAGVKHQKGALIEVERHFAESIVRFKAGKIVPTPPK